MCRWCSERLLHSLQMAQEDTARWCRGLDDRELHARPFNLPSVAFQLRHIARSLDRFCSYAEGTPLSPEQFAALASEMDGEGTRESIFSELEESLDKTRRRLDAIVRQPLDLPVSIGRKALPTTLTGLLIHAAEHTQRHVGQAITTAKLIVAQRRLAELRDAVDDVAHLLLLDLDVALEAIQRLDLGGDAFHHANTHRFQSLDLLRVIGDEPYRGHLQ